MFSHFSPTFSTFDNLAAIKGYYNLDNQRDIDNAKIQIGSSMAIINTLETGYKKHLMKLQANQAELVFLDNKKIKELAKINENNERIGDSLCEMNLRIDDMHQSLDISLQALLEQNRIANTKIDTIISWIRLPEGEKEKLFYFEKGMGFLKQVFKNKERYKDAESCFTKAYQKDNYMNNYQLGLIYLYAKDYIDFHKAKQYLLEAADYCGSDDNKNLGSRIYLHLGYCSFLTFDFDKAITYLNLSYKLDHNCLESKDLQMSCYSALENPKKIVENLRLLTSKNKDFLFNAMNNFNISKFTEVKEFAEEYKRGMKQEIYNKLEELNAYENIDLTNYKKDFNKIDKLIKDNTFNSLFSAISLASTYTQLSINEHKNRIWAEGEIMEKQDFIKKNLPMLSRKHRNDVNDNYKTLDDKYFRIRYWIHFQSDRDNYQLENTLIESWNKDVVPLIIGAISIFVAGVFVYLMYKFFM